MNFQKGRYSASGIGWAIAQGMWTHWARVKAGGYGVKACDAQGYIACMSPGLYELQLGFYRWLVFERVMARCM